MPATVPSRIFEPRRGRRQIDRRAWRCLEKCRKKLRLDALLLPIPVEEWIEGPLDIRFGFSDLAHLGDDVLGAAFVADREIVIDERVLQHEGRYRFTCAHELGHLVLHKKVQSVFHETTRIEPFSSPDRYERQADRFAAAFLMPVPLLERELLRICDDNGLRQAEAVVQLMKPTLESEWLWRKRVLPRITRRFEVSLSAAVNRFSDIQPKVPDSPPLLPTEFAEKLLRPAYAKGKFDSLWVEKGVAVRRELFGTNTHQPRAN